jgi:hypothetical protein
VLSVVLGLAHAILETAARRVASAVQEATFVAVPPVNLSIVTRVIPCKCLGAWNREVLRLT